MSLWHRHNFKCARCQFFSKVQARIIRMIPSKQAFITISNLQSIFVFFHMYLRSELSSPSLGHLSLFKKQHIHTNNLDILSIDTHIFPKIIRDFMSQLKKYFTSTIFSIRLCRALKGRCCHNYQGHNGGLKSKRNGFCWFASCGNYLNFGIYYHYIYTFLLHYFITGAIYF